MLVYHRVPFFAQAQSHLHLPRDRSMRARCGHPTDCAVTPGHPKQQNSLDIISYLFIAFYSHALSIQKFHEILYLSISIAQSMSEFIQSPPPPSPPHDGELRLCWKHHPGPARSPPCTAAGRPFAPEAAAPQPRGPRVDPTTNPG